MIILRNLFLEFSNEKRNLNVRKVDKTSRYYELLMKDMKYFFESYIQSSNFEVKPSVGIAQYAEIPWICVLSKNKRISPSAQKGIYIVMLFSKKGDFVELALGQGITNFREREKDLKKRRNLISNVVKYFQDEVNQDLIEEYGFRKDKISLGEKIGTLGRGYIETTIISKRFSTNELDHEDFLKSLNGLFAEYREIIENIGSKSYDDVIESIDPSDSLISSVRAVEEITEVLKDDYIELRDVVVTPVEVAKTTKRKNKYELISKPKTYRKTDYIKKAKEDHITGLKGEEIALNIERKRVEKLDLDPDIHVKYVANISDTFGYDIESVDYINGKLEKIYIEVKSTRDIKDTAFYVSRNELNVSKEKGINYQIFRIYDVTSQIPKYYRSNGKIDDNFYLDPVSYSARYKYNVN